MKLLKKFIGDRAFYKATIAIALPIMIQNGITNLVSLLDNIMVGRLGTEQMSGVSIVNQFVFVFTLVIFGAVSGAGIFTAQFFGKGDMQGVRNTFRFKIILNLVIAVVGIALFVVLQDKLIGLFLHEGESSGDLALTLEYGKKYLHIILVGMIPFSVSLAYASTMRETGDTVMPMIASMAGVATNTLLNWVLIFGYLGAPALGVRGAAIATVISRFVELSVLVAYAHTHTKRFPYLVGAFRSFAISGALFGKILKKAFPIMANEFFWSLAITMRNQCYSVRGLDSVAAQNISSTLVNLTNVVYMAIGSAIAIVVGKMLGAGEIKRAKDTAGKMIAFSMMAATAMGVLLSGVAFVFPLIYNTSAAVKSLATYMMIISAVAMPFSAFAFSTYFTLRSGGRVMVTIIFDSVFMWGIVIPLTAALTYFTTMPIHTLFAVCQLVEITKLGVGLLLMKKVDWARQLDVVSDV